MKFSNHKIVSLFFLLFLGGMNLIAQNLSVCSVEFPDTVSIGETVTLKGYVVNKDNIAYTDNITVLIDVEDIAPSDILIDEEINESVLINQNLLNPNDSIYFEKDVLINAQEFGVAGTDLVIIWPQISGNDGVIDNEADIQLTYVEEEMQEEAEANDNWKDYDFLPDGIKNYIEQNYPDAFIDHICTVGSNFKIKLDDEVELIFSIDGILREMEEDKHNNYGDDDDDNYGDYEDDDDDKGYADDDDDKVEDDDDGHSDDDGKDHSDDDDDDGKDHSDDDDDDDNGHDDDNGYLDDDDDDGKDFWNREMETSAVKIIVNNQVTQIVISDKNFEIMVVELYEINGRFIHRLSNQSKSTNLSIPIQNLNYLQPGILKIYMKNEKGLIVELNKKFIHTQKKG